MSTQSITIKTGEGQGRFTTRKIVGNLNNIIVKVNEKDSYEEEGNSFFHYYMQRPEKIDIIIESSLGYLVFHRKQLDGITYFAPRVKVTPMDEDLRDVLTYDKFKLDEELLITVIGPKNIDVELIIGVD